MRDALKNLKAAEAAVEAADELLTEKSHATITPFMDSFDVFFKKWSICRLLYFGGSLQGEHINTIFSSSLVIEEMTALLKVRDIDVGHGRTLKLGSDSLAAGHRRLPAGH